MPPLKYLRLQPFDRSSEAGRSAERYRLAWLAMLANFASRAATMVVLILAVRWTTPYLGAERFGVWMAIVALTGVLAFLDLGVGHAMTSRVARISASGSPDDLRRTVSGGLGLLALMAGAMGVALTVVAHFLPWQSIIKVTNPAHAEETRTAALVFCLLFSATILTSGVQRVFHALQRAHEAHGYLLAGSVLSLVGLAVSAHFEAGIAVLLANALGAQVVAGIALLLVLLRRGLLSLSGLPGAIAHEWPYLARVGSAFLVLQVGTVIGWGMDSILISSTLGATAVAGFALTQRIFQFATQPLHIVNAPLWAAYADAKGHGDHAFIRRTLKRSLALNIAFSFTVGALLIGFGSSLIKYWTKGAVEVPTILILVYAAWAVFDVTASSFAMFLNGVGLLRPQVCFVLSMVVIALPTKLVVLENWGVSAMLASFTVFFVASLLLWHGVVFRSSIRSELGLKP